MSGGMQTSSPTSPSPFCNCNSAETTTTSSKNFLSNLLHRMDPRACTCLTPHYNDPNDFDSMVQRILEDLADDNSRHHALQRLFHETDLSHQHNRVPIVCTSQWDAVGALATCLDRSEDRRLTCLTLNNLSIPFENKAVMVFGPSSHNLLGSVLQVIQNGQSESYLCCILLMNLTYLDDAKVKLVRYPNATNDDDDDPLQNPKSLLRTIDLVLKAYTRFLKRPVLSVEAEAVRWSMGLVRNVTTTEEGADLVSQTDIARYAVTYVRDSRKPLYEWTQDSLEDLSLQVLVNLATFPASTQRLKTLDNVTEDAFDSIVGKGGIHDVRASFLQVHLQ